MKGSRRLPHIEGCSVPGGLVFGACRAAPSTEDLPGSKGTYVLILRLERAVEMTIGRLGRFAIQPGHYAYVGSAFGPGGLAARLGHHLRPALRPHWHIDYLSRAAAVIEIWLAATPQRLETAWVQVLAEGPGWRVPIPGFGASDDLRPGSSHLFCSPQKPSYRWFRRQVAARWPGVLVVRRVPRAPAPPAA